MVKFRVKLLKRSFTVDLKPDNENENRPLTLQDLRLKLENSESVKSLCRNDFEISLNGKDPLTGDSATLQDLGLVSGDLIRLIVNNPSRNAPDEPQVRKGDGACAKDASTSKILEAPSEARRTSKEEETSCSGLARDSTEAGPSARHSAAAMETERENEAEGEEDTIQDDQARILLDAPMLVRESRAGRVPEVLSVMYGSAGVVGAHEAVGVVLHALMREAGFRPTHQGHSMPGDWRKSGGVYKTCYTVACDAVKSITLTYVTLGSVANVVCTVSECEIKRQLQLNPAEYVTSVCENAGDTYKNLSKLSTLFKDKISYPVLQSLRSGSGSPLPGLDNLIAEVQLLILKHLSAKDLLSLSAVNRHFHAVARDKLLWRRLYVKDFGRRVDSNDLSQDWFKLYKDKYVLRERMRENARLMASQVLPPPFRDPYADPYPLHPGYGYPPGFVGGDYDRDPNFGGMFGPGGGAVPPSMLPRPRYDPIGPHPDMRRPQRPPLPGWGPPFGGHRRDPAFGSGGFGFM